MPRSVVQRRGALGCLPVHELPPHLKSRAIQKLLCSARAYTGAGGPGVPGRCQHVQHGTAVRIGIACCRGCVTNPANPRNDCTGSGQSSSIERSCARVENQSAHSSLSKIADMFDGLASGVDIRRPVNGEDRQTLWQARVEQDIACSSDAASAWRCNGKRPEHPGIRQAVDEDPYLPSSYGTLAEMLHARLCMTTSCSLESAPFRLRQGS